MKVSECLKNIPEKPLGYIRMVDCVMGGEAHERTLDSYSITISVSIGLLFIVSEV